MFGGCHKIPGDCPTLQADDEQILEDLARSSFEVKGEEFVELE